MLSAIYPAARRRPISPLDLPVILRSLARDVARIKARRN
jgi:hypothetical protein